MSYRDTASYGKRQEYAVIAELLKRNFDVYMTLVDDQGIDCVIRINQTQYLDIQIKARSDSAKQPRLFAGISIEPRDNYFFIFYTEIDNTFWIMPSNDVVNLASTNESGTNKGKHSITMPTTGSRKRRKDIFEKYKNESGFNLLLKPIGNQPNQFD